MEEKKYDKQALDIILNGGAVKGQNFVDGVFLYVEDEFIKELNRQKFRKLTIMTMKELSG